MSEKKQLSELEKLFIAEAEAGHFIVEYEDDGSPCAFGAPDTDNLFTMDVVQERIGKDESNYFLPHRESDD